MLIARLIADADALLSNIETLKGSLAAEGMPIEASAEPIARGVLVEVRTMGSKRRVLRAALERAFPQCDGLIAQDDIRVPGLFVSDMDSTMIGQECIDELAGFAGLKDKVAAITERAMQGELDFENALRERVSLLEGLDESAITRCLAERIRPNPGARELVETLNSIGCTTVLVTGGFHHFADPVAEQIGFARVVGNRLAVAGGKLTGGLDGPVVDSSTKKAVLDEEQGRLAAGTASAAAGDGANDIPMIEAATYGIAYRAKPKAREVADCWIDRGDLTSILTLLGIK